MNTHTTDQSTIDDALIIIRATTRWLHEEVPLIGANRRDAAQLRQALADLSAAMSCTRALIRGM